MKPNSDSAYVQKSLHRRRLIATNLRILWRRLNIIGTVFGAGLLVVIPGAASGQGSQTNQQGSLTNQQGSQTNQQGSLTNQQGSQTNQQGNKAENQRAAMNDMAAPLVLFPNSPVAKQLQELHGKMMSYQWRTVYSLSQVSKAPLPGTRLAIKPDPAMSQLDAENFLLGMKVNVPAMNCPVATLGGPAGRLITVQLGPKTVQLTDQTIRLLLQKADPSQAENIWRLFSQLRDGTCAAIYGAAQLNYRYQRYLTLQKNIQACKTDGVQITAWQVGEKLKFPGNKKRTLQAGGGVTFKCGAVYNGSPDDAFTYASWFKWSDDKEVPLNLIQTLLQSSGSPPNSCPKACVPVIGAESVSASICIGLDPGIPPNGSPLPLRLGAKIRYAGRTKELCSPIIYVPAPLGISNSLNEMADNGKQQLKTQLEQQLMAVLPISSSTIAKLSNLASLMQ